MNDHHHHSESIEPDSPAPRGAVRSSPPWRTSLSATLHCLTGCAIGEVVGMAFGTGLGWSNAATIAVSIALAFAFGYTLTLLPLVRGGLRLPVAFTLAFASDTLSIALMELVDNLLMLAIPGAMDAGPAQLLFWTSMAASLVSAGVLAWPLNHWLIRRGLGHARVHSHHH